MSSLGAQRPKQCTLRGLLGSPGRALASHGPQDRQFTYSCAVVQYGGSPREHCISRGHWQPCGQLADGTRGGYNCHNQGYIYGGAQVDHGDNQERALGGQLGYGDPS
jgi:hypothetical protein